MGARIRPGELVLDIGAGQGAITAELVRAGARVIAVELHPGRAAVLRRHFEGAPVRVVQADAADLHLPTRSFSVVANPPFAITTAVLRRLLSRRSRLRSARLVLPLDVAVRWAAGRGPSAPAWHIHVAARLRPSAFTPPARQPVAVLAIESSDEDPVF